MDFDFNRLLADAAREMDESSAAATLGGAVELCTQAIAHCDVAGISVIDGEEIRTLVASSDELRRVDQLQRELREGPHFRDADQLDTIVCNDLDTDPRWPTWGPRTVSELGLRSTLSLRLFTTETVSGALSLYAVRTDAFAPDDLVEGHAIATQAAIALATGFKESQLHRALETRTVIGQATGILIERFGLAPDQAFAVMRRVSQSHNVKLHAVASHLVDTGELPSQGSVGSDSAWAEEPSSSEA